MHLRLTVRYAEPTVLPDHFFLFVFKSAFIIRGAEVQEVRQFVYKSLSESSLLIHYYTESLWCSMRMIMLTGFLRRMVFAHVIIGTASFILARFMDHEYTRLCSGATNLPQWLAGKRNWERELWKSILSIFFSLFLSLNGEIKCGASGMKASTQ